MNDKSFLKLRRAAMSKDKKKNKAKEVLFNKEKEGVGE